MAHLPSRGPIRRQLAHLLDGLLGAGARARCGLGWYGLICDLLLALAPERHRAGTQFTIARVCADPVSGRMRVETTGALTETARTLIARAEAASGLRCELCGAIGARMRLPGGGALIACGRHLVDRGATGMLGHSHRCRGRASARLPAQMERRRSLYSKHLRH